MVVEQVLEHQDWLLGEKFSSADIYLLMLSTWSEDEEEFD
jgi:glutathione S-transferase